jgi:hypothetical protein
VQTGNLQIALYSKLTGNATLMALIDGIYAQTLQPDDAELASDFPYVTLGKDRPSPWDTNTNFGVQAICPIDVWSRSGNYLEGKTIADEIWRTLHYQPLTITGANHTMTIVQSVLWMQDPDNLTKHGVIQAQVTYSDVT